MSNGQEGFLGKDEHVLEVLIRKAYHDGINLCGPMREIVCLKVPGDAGKYISTNLAYYLSLLKNLRFFYMLKTAPEFFSVEEFEVGELIKEIFLDSAFPHEENVPEITSSLCIKTQKEIIYMLLFNLMGNAYRFGKDVSIYIDNNKVVIENKVLSPLKEHEIDSIYDLPLLPDKNGIMGAGVGLRIVKEIIELLNLELSSKVDSSEIKIVLTF